MNQSIQYFAKEPKIYPKRVWGRYRIMKWVLMAVTLGIYYLAPFVRWDRGENAPNQAILIDMANHRGYFFFIEIWPQEVYYLTGLLILAAVGLFFITSLAGRVWCGYLCFQTVWTDLFVWVERIVQGDRNARKKLDESRLTWEKIYKKTITHMIWLVIGACTGGAWVLYFNDAPTLMDNLAHGHIDRPVLGWVIALTLTTYLMAGFARQQVCKYMCPYARFQSAMFDRNTLIIGYDEVRGEPRGKLNKDGIGDCIDCSLCVQVCPMGIDIRDGLHYECIACGLCIDACNGVMEKIQRPAGLIRYDTMVNQELRAAGMADHSWKHYVVRWRSVWYVGIMTVVGSVMLYALVTRSPQEMNILHDRNPLMVKLSDGSIRNGYDVRILNKTHEDRSYRLRIEGIDGARIMMQGAGQNDPEHIPVFADSVGHIRIFVIAPPKEAMAERHDIRFILEDLSQPIITEEESMFIYEP
ncbi:MAG: cytochrome c oxidase accessory protein CcoG [Alphaproteobacteria bacterium]|nr:MAG: cytochrome c oxidase accessory protein CcoG [Alphaproteobacteria bacterium]TAF14455.1 MAG: cytochrome c oxidase accessory protein CcoG [Alphaproteobacteria bacterium]TAF38764.1 MAG: cytochrome c oxidase accessory protein CcoG [Alphaproteobacteria bacterium]TAF77608.1 MAG: cytochrome c oxidase accessory protein CcoG [Alphaproteobacteria bacterium]